MKRDEVWDALKENAKRTHDARVAKTPDRVQYAIQQFEENNICFALKNETTGHFHCRRLSDNKLFQFWASTGRILGHENKRGIHALVRMLKDMDNPREVR